MSRKRTKLFIQIYHELYDSETWRGMHWYSKLAYLRIKRKYNPRRSEEISVSYREMLDEMTQPTFAKAIRELEKRELIKITQKGGLYRKRNYYALSESWRRKKQLTLNRVLNDAKRSFVEVKKRKEGV